MGYQARKEIICIVCKSAPAIGRKLCRVCYNEAWQAERLDDYPPLTAEDVFEDRIEKTPTCWLWTGGKNGYGYGIFILPGEKKVRAHRYSYEHFIGPIPEGKIILHTCDNPPCVNPAHLRVGTKADNNKDTSIKRRHNYGLNHWNGKLSDEDVRAIRESKETQTALGKRYGVSQSHIWHIKHGTHRKFVT